MGGGARYGLTISPSFDPVTRDTVSSQVRLRLAEAITVGDLAPGSPLPPERTLCQEFGVARTSVREAIQGLVIAGFVERRGNRSVVAERLPDLDLGAEAPADPVAALVELRQAIDPTIAALAAERATPDQRRQIVAAAPSLPDLAELRRADVVVADLCARAAASPLLAEVHAKAFALGRTTGSLGVMWSPGVDVEAACAALVRLSSAVDSADPTAARTAATALLDLIVG